jgi:WD40 repeat protein
MPCPRPASQRLHATVQFLTHCNPTPCSPSCPAACGSFPGWQLLVSGAADNTVRVWAWRSSSSSSSSSSGGGGSGHVPPQWACLHTLEVRAWVQGFSLGRADWPNAAGP